MDNVNDAMDTTATSSTFCTHCGLVGLAQKYKETDYRRKPAALLSYEKAAINEWFAARHTTPDFKRCWIRAVMLAAEDFHLEMLTLLLEHDVHHTLLRQEHTAVTQVLSMYAPEYEVAREEPESIVSTIALLLAHGAPVQPHGPNAMDSDAIYVACRRGLGRCFQKIVEAGGHYRSLHSVLPVSNIDDSTASFLISILDATLLALALDSWFNDRYPDIWQVPLMPRWDNIFLFLLRRCNDVDVNRPALLALLHVACWQGNLPLVRILISLGVSINTPAQFSPSRPYFSGSALHAAVEGGQKAVVVVLLSVGADPSLEKKHTGGSVTGDVTSYMTPIRAASRTRNSMRSETNKIYHVWELLFEWGVNDEDVQQLFDYCVQVGSVKMTKRLMDAGLEMEHVPDGLERHKNGREMLQLALDRGACAKCEPPSKAQHAALSVGATDILASLVAKQGKFIDPSAGIAFWLRNIMGNFERGDKAMLTWLIHEYRFDVNTIMPVFAGGSLKTNMLGLVLEEYGYLEAIRFLLDNGADVDCPGLDEDAFELLCTRFKSRTRHWQIIIPTLRLLMASKHGMLDSKCDPRRLVAEHLPSRVKDPENYGTMRLQPYPPLSKPAETFVMTSHFIPHPPQPALDHTRAVFKHENLFGALSIRLLEIQPDAFDVGIITGRIVHTTLYGAPPYEVLSYSRDASPSITYIQIDETIYAVTQKLWSALRRVRHPHEAILVWVDAICVNQENAEERSMQTMILRDIVREATALRVYLGESAEDSALLFEAANEWRRKIEMDRNGPKPPRSTTREESSKRRAERSRFLKSTSNEVQSAFQKMLMRDWFDQPWNLLELKCCKKATAVCGEDSEDFFVVFGLKGSRSNHFGSVHTITKPTSWQLLERNIDSWDTSELGPLLGYAIYCRSIDPRDAIFAVLAYINHEIMVVDYSLSTAQVYQQFTQHVIEKTNNLWLLHWKKAPGEHHAALPSWCPNFSIVNPTMYMPNVFYKYYTSIARQTCLPGLRFSHNHLIAKGQHLDTIKALGDEMPTHIHTSSPDFAPIFRSWERLALQINPATNNWTASCTDIFLVTICARNLTNYSGSYEAWGRMASSAPGFASWYKHFGTGVLGAADPVFFAEQEAVQRWFDQSPASGYYFGDSVVAAGKGRRFFVSEGESMGLAPGEAREGDGVVYLGGCHQPVVVREVGEGEGEKVYRILGDCYLYGLQEDKLFKDEERIVEYRIC